MDFKKNTKLYSLNELLKSADIFYGSGGSDNAIMVYKNNAVKIIPDFEISFNQKEKGMSDQEEIKFYKEFTKHLIMKNKTPHIVGYYKAEKLNMYNLLNKFSDKCKKLSINDAKKQTLWEQLYLEKTKPKLKPNNLTNNQSPNVKSVNSKKDISASTDSNILKKIFNFFKTSKSNYKKELNKSKKYNQKYNQKDIKYYGKYAKYNKKTKKISKYDENIKELLCETYTLVNGKYATSYPWNKIFIEKIFDICYLECCPESIHGLFKKLVNNNQMLMTTKEQRVEEFIERVIFQFMFTMCAIYEKYPSFIHNDCFLRNILAIEETKYKNNDVIEYIVKRKNGNTQKYYTSANGICIKLNDFGFSLALPDIGSKVMYNRRLHESQFITKYNRTKAFSHSNKYKNDIWNFLLDLYNGGNFGATSCLENIQKSSLSLEDKNKLSELVKNKIHNFIDTDKIDKLIKNSKGRIYGIWNIANLPEIQKTVQYPENYFINTFNFSSYQLTDEDLKNKKIIKTFIITIN